jgi:hypothetical protein
MSDVCLGNAKLFRVAGLESLQARHRITHISLLLLSHWPAGLEPGRVVQFIEWPRVYPGVGV